MGIPPPPPGVPPPEPTPPEYGAVGALAGTPYHRLARTRRYRWWRPALGTFVLAVLWVGGMFAVLVGFLVGGVAAGLNVFPGGTRFFANPVINIAALLAIIVIAIPAVLLTAWAVQRRPPGTVSSVTGRLRWRWLVTCLGVAVATVIVAFGVSQLLPAPGGAVGPGAARGWVGWPRFLVAAAVLVSLVPLQSAAEEYVFRGWVIQTVGAYLRLPWLGIGAGAVLFALAHGLGTTWGFADLLLFGGVSGWLAVRTGGIEPGIALHTANNLVAFLLSAAFGSLGVVRTAAQGTWTLFVVDIVLLPMYAWLVTRLARRGNLPSTVP